MNAMAIMVAGVAIALLSLLLVSRRKPQSVGSHAKARRGTRRTRRRTSASDSRGFPSTPPPLLPGRRNWSRVRFHPDDAPTLPLPGLFLDVQVYLYVHHSDRRSGTLTGAG